MALTMPSTALPQPVGASSKNGLDEAKPAFFGGAARLSLTFLCQSPFHDSFFFFNFLCLKTNDFLVSSKLLARSQCCVEQRNWIPETKCSLVQCFRPK